MTPTTSTPLSPRQLEDNFTKAVTAWSHTIIHQDSDETIQVAQEVIKKIWLKDAHSSYVNWSRITNGAPLAIKIAWVEVVRNKESLKFNDISSLWHSLSDENKELSYPKISRWIIEDLSTNANIYAFQLEACTKTFMEFLNRGWIKDITENNKKEDLLRYILIGFFRTGNQDGIAKVLPFAKNLKGNPLYYALQSENYVVIKKLLDLKFQVTDFKWMLFVTEKFSDDIMIELLDAISVGRKIPDDFLYSFLEKRSKMSVRLIRWFIDHGNSLEGTLLGPYVAKACSDKKIPLVSLRVLEILFPRENENKNNFLNRIIRDDHIKNKHREQMVDILLYAGCDPYAADKYGDLPLEKILSQKNNNIPMGILRVFHEHLFDFRRPMPNGKSLLHELQDRKYSCDYAIVRFLIMEAGYPLGPIYEGGPSVIHLYKNDTKILEYCLKHGETFCEKDGTFKHIKPERAFERLYDLGKISIEHLTGINAGQALRKEIEVGNKEKILYLLEHCHPILDINDGGCLINDVKDLTLIDPLMELLERQQIACNPNLPEIFEKNGYVFYKTIADKFSQEKKVKIFSDCIKWYFHNPAREYIGGRISEIEFDQYMIDISKTSAAYFVHLLDIIFENSKLQDKVATWILLNPEVFNFSMCIKMLVVNLILYRPSNSVLELLKKAISLAKDDKNGKEEIEKALNLFARQGSSANLSEEEYSSILSCFEFDENQKWPINSFYTCNNSWPRRPFWNAIRKALDRIPEFPNPIDKGGTVLHSLCWAARKFGQFWKDHQPQSEGEWNECRAVLKEMIQYACEKGAAKHLKVHFYYKRLSPLHMFEDGDFKPDPNEHPNFDEIARMVFIDVMEYGAVWPYESPLHTACCIKWISLIRDLIKKGYSPNASMYKIICEEGNFEVAKALFIDQ